MPKLGGHGPFLRHRSTVAIEREQLRASFPLSAAVQVIVAVSGPRRGVDAGQHVEYLLRGCLGETVGRTTRSKDA